MLVGMSDGSITSPSELFSVLDSNAVGLRRVLTKVVLAAYSHH